MDFKKVKSNTEILVKDEGNKVFYRVVKDDDFEDSYLCETTDIMNEECIKGFLGRNITEVKLLNSKGIRNLSREVLQVKRNDGMILEIISRDLHRNFLPLMDTINTKRCDDYINYSVNAFNYYKNLNTISFNLSENNTSISINKDKEELICHIPYKKNGTSITIDEQDSKMVQDIISEYFWYIDIDERMDDLCLYTEGGMSICTKMTINTGKAKIVIDGMKLVDSLSLYLELLRREIDDNIINNNNGMRENKWLVRKLKK